MWGSVIVFVIVGLAVFHIGRTIYRSVRAKGSGICNMCLLKDRCQKDLRKEREERR